MPPRDSTLGTLVVALALCVVCSLFVSSAAVSLRPIQERNQELDKKKNILEAAGYADQVKTPADIDRIYDEHIEEVLVDLASGEPVSDEKLAEAGFASRDAYDAEKAAKDKELQQSIKPDGSLPGFAHRAPFVPVYKVVDSGEGQGFIFPVYGKGLWSTLEGFLALEADGKTVKGITFFKHKETPGLGGEVDNPNWKASWKSKQVFDPTGEKVVLTVVKGTAASDTEIDGLSGATITSKGVDNLVKYWLGPTAFGPFLEQQN